MRPVSARGAVSVGVVLAAWFFLFAEVFTRGRVVLRGDLGSDMWPSRRLFVFLAAESVSLPSWNPFFSAGQPFAANPQHAVFHPLTSLFLVLPFAWAFRLQVLLPPLVAAATMWFLLRELGRSPTARLFGALAWAFGGYLLSSAVYLPVLFPVSVLPAVLAYAVRLGRRARAADVAGLAVFFGVEALSGEPTGLFITVLLAVTAFAAGSSRAATEAPPSDSILRRASFLLGAFGLGAVVGAAALLPAARLFANTSRAGGLPSEEVGDYSLPPLRFAELVVPDLTGAGRADPGTAPFRARLYPFRKQPFFASLYPGLLVTALALFAFADGAGRVRIFLPALVAGALLAPGVHAPFFGFTRAILPALSQTRFPEKFVLLLVAPVTIAAAFGLDALLAARRPRRRILVVALLLFGAGGAALLSGGGGTGETSAWIAGQLVRSAVVAALGAGLVLLVGHAPRTAGAGILLLTAGELVVEGRRLLPSSPVAEAAAPPVVISRLLAAPPRGYLFHLASFHPELRQLAGLGVPPKPNQFGIATALDRDWGATQLAWSARAVHAVSRALEIDGALAGPIFARRGISTVVRFRPGAPPPAAARDEPLLSLVEIRSVPDPQPFVFSARHVRLIRSEDDWLEAVRHADTDVRSTVFVERESWGERPVETSPAQIALLHRGPDHLEILVDVAGPAPAVVAINGTWDPFWRAHLDGIETPLLRADFDLEALRVPRGRHRVELRYEDGLLTWGAALTLLALGFCIALARRS